MLLAINVGNSNTYFGFFDKKELIASFRISTDSKRNQSEYSALFQKFSSRKAIHFDSITNVVIGSVVPKVTPKIEAFLKQKFPLDPLVVSGNKKLPIKLLVGNPGGVGADIIANLVAANEIYIGKILVIDFGTATTFNLLSEKSSYEGSVIAPGLDLMTNYLSEKTALLPKVSITKPKKVVGKNTVDCMTSGIFYGYIGLVEHIIKNIKKEQGKMKVIATGGNSIVLAREISGIDLVYKNLTLEGLRAIHHYSLKK